METAACRPPRPAGVGLGAVSVEMSLEATQVAGACVGALRRGVFPSADAADGLCAGRGQMSKVAAGPAQFGHSVIVDGAPVVPQVDGAGDVLDTAHR